MKTLALSVLSTFLANSALAFGMPQASTNQWAEANPSWVAPVEPFRIVEDIYYVGTEGLAVYLITSEEGHILIDGGLPENAPQIVESIAALGYDIRDVRILLNSHAHFDHSGGLAELKELSGARLIASHGDRSALEGGFYLGAEDKPEYGAPPVPVDEIVEDGGSVRLGGKTLTAHLTPGHTRGCTSWTMDVPAKDGPLEALFFCSATVAGNRLVGPPQYEGIVEDYRHTFDITRDWRPDIYLSNHPFFFGMESKRRRLASGEDDAFVDREMFPAMMKRLEADFERILLEQKAAQE